MPYKTTHLRILLTTFFQDILSDIAHLPNGYAFTYVLQYSSLQDAVLKKWTQLFIHHFYTEDMRNTIVLACLDENGLVTLRTKRLYNWTLKYLYSNEEGKLYGDWLVASNVIAQGGIRYHG